MPTEITASSFLPISSRQAILKSTNEISNTTFVGIDFGTSTTVVSISTFHPNEEKFVVEPVWIEQLLADGSTMSSEKISSAIAWVNKRLFIGNGAAELKYNLKRGVNAWYSFKMELGEDLGPKYYNSELGRNTKTPIQSPRDAAKVFFAFLKEQLDMHIRKEGLPQNVRFAVSIPASFEANQRRDLVYALVQSGIAVDTQSLIDEPNAAFISYVQAAAMEGKPLLLPDGDNPKVLVFDFGAGTCDISILELGKGLNGVYSKNLSISKFEKLGGDDIDKYIAQNYLFPQLLHESGKKTEDFRTPERTRIESRLMKTAEQLKINICKSMALKVSEWNLPEQAKSNEYVTMRNSIEIDSRRGRLTLTDARLSYNDFNNVMKVFLSPLVEIPFLKTHGKDFVSIFEPIESALKKATMNEGDIDYVLLIGGSSMNPYIQVALKEYFSSSEILVPRDSQTHVSAGTAIHSLVFNGFKKNIIQPITSEPLLIITKDRDAKVILRAGTPIPCETIVIDDLKTDKDGQQAIEIPVCLGNRNKLLYSIKIVCNDQHGFTLNTKVRLELNINSDKLLNVKADADGQSVTAEPMNPFANKELSIEETIILKAERQANIDAERNGGKPSKDGLKQLHEAYENAGYFHRAAETLEVQNELYPDVSNYNQIGYYYSSAGYRDKAFECFKLAYTKDKCAVTAFNYALHLKHRDPAKAISIFEESLKMNPNYPYSKYELGLLLKGINDQRSKALITSAFDIWNSSFNSNTLSENDYYWLHNAANELGKGDLAEHVMQSKPNAPSKRFYNPDNLTRTAEDEGLIIIN